MKDRRRNLVRAEHIINQRQKGPAGQAGEVLAMDATLQVAVKPADWDRLGYLMEKVEMK